MCIILKVDTTDMAESHLENDGPGAPKRQKRDYEFQKRMADLWDGSKHKR